MLRLFHVNVERRLCQNSRTAPVSARIRCGRTNISFGLIEPAQDEFHASLSRPETRAVDGQVDPINKRVSRVFMARDRIQTLKRALAFSYLAFRKPRDRRQFHEEEVLLHRQTSPCLYVGVVPATR